MAYYLHPNKDDITLTGLLGALSDPTRLTIIRTMLGQEGCISCTEAAPCADMAKSTLSHHFRILREAGLIRTEKRGVESRNILRREDLEDRFPGLLAKIIGFSDRG
jgi:DNA-binding transcriptional ArsR family regulator